MEATISPFHSAHTSLSDFQAYTGPEQVYSSIAEVRGAMDTPHRLQKEVHSLDCSGESLVLGSFLRNLGGYCLNIDYENTGLTVEEVSLSKSD